MIAIFTCLHCVNVDLVIKGTDVEDDDDEDDDRYISEKMSTVDEMIRITRRNEIFNEF